MLFFQNIHYFISLNNVWLKFSSALWPLFPSVLLPIGALLSFLLPCFRSNLYGIRPYSSFVPILKRRKFSSTTKKWHPCLLPATTSPTFPPSTWPWALPTPHARRRPRPLSPLPRAPPTPFTSESGASRRGPFPASCLCLVPALLCIFPPFPALREENWMISVRSQGFWDHGGQAGRDYS